MEAEVRLVRVSRVPILPARGPVDNVSRLASVLVLVSDCDVLAIVGILPVGEIAMWHAARKGISMARRQ